MDSRSILSSENLIQLFHNTSQKCPSIKSAFKLIESENSELEVNQIRHHLDQMKQFIEKPLVDRINNLSEAEWIPQLKCSRVVKKVGKKWNQFGHRFMGNDVLYPEEAAYLLEINDLRLIHNGVPLSVQTAFALLLSNETGCTLEEYRVYAYFVSTGYRVFRHESISIETDTQADESVSQHATNVKYSNTANPDNSLCVLKQAVGRHEPSEHKSKMLVRVSTSCSGGFNVKFTNESMTRFDDLTSFIDRLYVQRKNESILSGKDPVTNDMSEDIVASTNVEHEKQKEINSANITRSVNIANTEQNNIQKETCSNIPRKVTQESSSSEDENDEARGINEKKETKMVKNSDTMNNVGSENSSVNITRSVNEEASFSEDENDEARGIDESKETKIVKKSDMMNNVDTENSGANITRSVNEKSSSSEDEDDETKSINGNKETSAVSRNETMNNADKENSDANFKSLSESSSSEEEGEKGKMTKIVKKNGVISDVDKLKVVTVTSSSSSSSEEEDTDSDDSDADVNVDERRKLVTANHDDEIVTLSSSEESISEIQEVPTIKKEIITLSSENSSEEEEENNVRINENTTIKAEEFIPFNNINSDSDVQKFGPNRRANITCDKNQNKYYMNRTAIKRAFHQQQGKVSNRQRNRFKKRFKHLMDSNVNEMNSANMNQISNKSLESDLLSEQTEQPFNENQATSCYMDRRTQMERNILNKQRRLSLQNKQDVLKFEAIEEGNKVNETSRNTDDSFQKNNVQNTREFSNVNELNLTSNEFGVENIESTVSNFVQNAVQQLTHAMNRNRFQPNLNVSHLGTNLFNSNVANTAPTSQILPDVTSYQQFPPRSSFNQFSMPINAQPPPPLLGLQMNQPSVNFSSPHQSVPSNSVQFNPNVSSNPPALTNTVIQLSQLKSILDGINANIQNSVDGLYKMNRFQRRQYYHRPYNPNFRRRYQNNRNFNNRNENGPTCGSDSNRNENNRFQNNRNFNNRIENDLTFGSDNRNDNQFQNNRNFNNPIENGPTVEYDNFKNHGQFQNGWTYNYRNQIGYPDNRNTKSDYNQERRNQNDEFFMRQNHFENDQAFGNRNHASHEFGQRNNRNFRQRFRHPNRFGNNMNSQGCDNGFENNRRKQLFNSDPMMHEQDLVNRERTNENSEVKQEAQETSEDDTSDEETSTEEEEDVDNKEKVKEIIEKSEELIKVKNETNNMSETNVSSHVKENGRIKVENSSTSESEIESDDQETEENIFLDVSAQNSRIGEEKQTKESENGVKKIVTIVDESSFARRTHIRFQYSSDDDDEESNNNKEKNVEIKVEKAQPKALAETDSDQELERENEKVLTFFSHVISEEEENNFLSNFPNRPYDLIKHIHSTILTKARIKLINRKICKLCGEDRKMLKFILKKEQTRLKKIRYNVRKRIMKKRLWGETKMVVQINQYGANSEETLSKEINNDGDNLNEETSELDYSGLLRDLNARKSNVEKKTSVVADSSNNVSKENVDLQTNVNSLEIAESDSKIVHTHYEKTNNIGSKNRSKTSEVNITSSHIACNDNSKQWNKLSEETNINTMKQNEKVKESLDENVKVTKIVSADEHHKVMDTESNNIISDNLNILNSGKQSDLSIEETMDVEVTNPNNTNIKHTSDVEMLNNENDKKLFESAIRNQVNLSSEEIKTSESDMLTLIKGRQDYSDYSSVFNALNIFSSPDHTEQPKLLGTRQPLKISFDVYCSSKQFAKTRKSTPNYRIVVVRPDQELPSPDQMMELKLRCSDSVPLIFAIVLPQSITLYQYADVVVPVLIEQLSH